MLGPRASWRLSGPNPIILTNSYLENSENWNLLKIVHICFNLARRFVAPKFRKSWHPWHWQWDRSDTKMMISHIQLVAAKLACVSFTKNTCKIHVFSRTAVAVCRHPEHGGWVYCFEVPAAAQPPSIITPAARRWGHATSLIKILLKLPHTPLHSVPPWGHCVAENLTEYWQKW